jgi:hypothetical protein
MRSVWPCEVVYRVVAHDKSRRLVARLTRAAGSSDSDECATKVGRPAPSYFELPGRMIVVPLDDWRKELYAGAVLERHAKNPREEFKRVRQQLQARNLIGVNGELVWKA